MRKIMSFNSDYRHYQEKVEDWLKDAITSVNVPEQQLLEAMEYSLMAGGKRIRPVLSLAVTDILGGEAEAILPFACSIEMIHTYSLIHDDLPCMDNDDYRRGKPTNHKVFGEAMAVLAGDALLNLAFEIMLSEAAKAEDSLPRVKTAKLIAQAAGARGMIGGQVIDITSEGKSIPYEQLCRMHAMKTGALLKASILAPAELLDASEAVRLALDNYAANIGLAFQIKDDILDCEGDSAQVGKSIGKDEKNNKSTFVTLLGIKKAKDLLKSSVEHAVEAIKPLNNADFLIKTAAYIAERDR